MSVYKIINDIDTVEIFSKLAIVAILVIILLIYNRGQTTDTSPEDKQYAALMEEMEQIEGGLDENNLGKTNTALDNYLRDHGTEKVVDYLRLTEAEISKKNFSSSGRIENLRKNAELRITAALCHRKISLISIFAEALFHSKNITNKKAMAYYLAQIAKDPNCDAYQILKTFLSFDDDLYIWFVFLEMNMEENKKLEFSARKKFFCYLFIEFTSFINKPVPV